MNSYQCDVCQHIYAPEQGDPLRGVEAGTAFQDLPSDWVCPVCGVGIDSYSVVEEVCEPCEMNM